MTTTYDTLNPMPGDLIAGSTVVASVVYREPDNEPWEWLVLLLNKATPFYTVAIVDENRDITFQQHYENIGPAVVDGYAQSGGDW